MDLDLRRRPRLALEAIAEQDRELVVVRVLLEQDAQAQERIAVAGVGLERAAERGHRLLADERLVHQRDAGEVMQRARFASSSSATAAWRVAASATSIHSWPLSAAWRQPSSAGTWPGSDGLGLAEPLRPPRRSCRSRRASRRRASRTRPGVFGVAVEVRRDLLLELGELGARSPLRRTIDSRWSSASRVARIDREDARGRARRARSRGGCRASASAGECP